MANTGVIKENGTIKMPRGSYFYNDNDGKPGKQWESKSIDEGTKITYSKKYKTGGYVYYYLNSQKKWVRLTTEEASNIGKGTQTSTKYGYNTVSISVKITGNVNVYAQNVGGAQIGTLKKGDKVTFNRKYQANKNSKVYMHYTSASCTPSSGWIEFTSDSYNKGTTHGNMKVTANNTKAAVNATTSNTYDSKNSKYISDLEKDSSGEAYSGVFTQEDSNYLDIGAGATTDYTDNISVDSLISDTMNGIMCVPYHFMSIADRRVRTSANKECNYGRKYAEKIVARMPLLFLTPGRPAFMQDYSATDRKNMLESIVGKGADLAKATAAYTNFLEDNGKFYSFDFKYEEYFRYVNPMLQIISKLMGIDKTVVKLNSNYSPKLGEADWSRALSKKFRNYLSAAECIPFYIDSATQISESFTNETSESSFASKVNSISEKAAEMNYLLGLGGSMLGEGKISSYISDFKESIKDIAGGSSSTLIDKLKASAATIGSGGRLVFPEVWSDSSFSRSYNIDIKLRTPDCDNLSIFMNIMVPFVHLLCLAAPQELSSNGYQSPFIVRAFYKGMFNVDLGIITNMEVTKGKESAWNVNGIPTQMDISLTIKDLYNEMFITGLDGSLGIKNNIFTNKAKDSAYKMVKNTAMMDYLANTCGLNLNKPEVARNVQIYLMLKGSQIKNWPHTKWLKFQQGVGNFLKDLY